MKKILVTGASGFIGFHLCLFLKKRNDFVIGYDNFNSYYNVALKLQREKILNENNIEVLHKDIRDKSSLKRVIEDNNITHIVHLAAQAGVRYSITNPEDYFESNINGFFSLLETCKLFPKIPIIYASSSSIYGLNENIPFNLSDNTDKPANFYGVTKKTNELMAHAYHHLYGIPLIGLRYFTVYGPWGRPDMAYYTFAEKIINGEEILLYNNGNMKRDFTYIDDIINGTIAAIDLSKEYGIFNLGNNNSVSLTYFLSILEDLLNKKAITKKLPMPSGEITQTYADISYSKEVLNFSPKTSIEQGLSNFVEWYLNYKALKRP